MDEFNSPDDVVARRKPDIPVTCFRPTALEAAAKWFTGNFPGKVLYAVKVNPAPYVISGLAQAGIDAFDVASIAEAEAVQAVSPGAFMAFMHPVKSRQTIEQAYFDFGIRDFAFDCIEELEKIVASTGASKDLGLVLRLSVPNTSSEHPLASKFGAAPEKAAELLKAARKVARSVGISFHVGSQTMDPQAYATALDITGSVLRAIPRTKVDIVDVGGGFPAVYADMSPPPLADYMTAIEQGIGRLPHPERYQFWCEPGRALVAESGSVVVQVQLRKDDTLYINDGSYGSLFDAAHMGLRYPVRLIRASGAVQKGPQKALKPFRFYGPTCDSIDYMPGPFMLPADTREGDYIEIAQLGAYGNTMRTAFNGFDRTETVQVASPPMVTMLDEPAEEKAFCAA